MLTTFDRYMREYRAKLLKARLERELPRDEQGTVAGIRIVQVIRQAEDLFAPGLLSDFVTAIRQAKGAN